MTIWDILGKALSGQGVKLSNGQIVNPVSDPIGTISKVNQTRGSTGRNPTVYDRQVNALQNQLAQAQKQQIDYKQVPTSFATNPFESVVRIMNSVKATPHDNTVNALQNELKQSRINQYNEQRANRLNEFNSLELNAPRTNDTTAERIMNGGTNFFDAAEINNNTDNIKYMTMTDDEKSRYFAVKQNLGQDKANQYLADITDELNKRVATETIKNSDPVTNNMLRYTAGVKSFDTNIGNTFNRIAGDTSIQPESTIQAVQNEIAASQTGAEKVVGDVLYGAGQFTKPAVIGLATGGVGLVPSAVAGGTAVALPTFGETYQRTKKEGYSDDQATAYATIEASINGLMGAAGGVPNVGANVVSKALGKAFPQIAEKVLSTPAAVQAIANVANNMGNEAAVSFVQGAFEPLIRNAALNENNEFNPVSEENLYNTVLGALTAGTMSVPGIKGDYQKARRLGQNDGQSVQDTAQKQAENAQIDTSIMQNNVSRLLNITKEEFLLNPINGFEYKPTNKTTTQDASIDVNSGKITLTDKFFESDPIVRGAILQHELTHIQSEPITTNPDNVKLIQGIYGLVKKSSYDNPYRYSKNGNEVITELLTDYKSSPKTMKQKYPELYAIAEKLNNGMFDIADYPEIQSYIPVYKKYPNTPDGNALQILDDVIAQNPELAQQKGWTAKAEELRKKVFPQPVVSTKQSTTTYSDTSPQQPVTEPQMQTQPITPPMPENAATPVQSPDTPIYNEGTPFTANELPDTPQFDNGQVKNRQIDSVTKSENLTPEQKTAALEDEVITKYKSVTNKDALEQANLELQADEQKTVETYFSKDAAAFTPKDKAIGVLLIQKYKNTDQERYIQAVRKLVESNTKSGQALQAAKMLIAELGPDSMVVYSQKQLDEFFNAYAEKKTKDWIAQNKSKYDLTAEDAAYIREQAQKAQTAKTDRERDLALSNIENRITSKMPSNFAQKLRTLQRMSLLLNPKTAIRNVLGNAGATPLFGATDLIATVFDRFYSKKYNTQRTTGVMNAKNVIKGGWKGLQDALFDFKNNVKYHNGKWEIGRGSAFDPAYANTNAGKALFKTLDRLDRFTNFILFVGDKPFYEGYFKNSIENQLRLNGVKEPTSDMLEIAHMEALQRTWQDTNGFTETFTSLQRRLNGKKDFGFGSILMPFVKTPANLLKAVFDFSPIGLTKTLAAEVRSFKIAAEKGTATPMMQKKLVDNLSKGIVGTLLSIGGYALASAGVLTAGQDDNKNKAAFEKNILGLQPYSVKIGDKTYSYNWSQPVGSTLAAVADIQKAVNRGADDSTALNVINDILSATNAGIDSILNLSLTQGLEQLVSSENPVNAVINTLTSLPAQFVPTLLSQFAQLVDPITRRTYVSGNTIVGAGQTAVNKVMARVPGLSTSLEPVVDPFGREVERYGGENNVGNVFFNPMTESQSNTTPGANEIQAVNETTGDNSVLPKVAPITITDKSKDYVLTMQEQTKYQKTAGQLNDTLSSEVANILQYQAFGDTEKADVLKDVVEYANYIAKQEFLNGRKVQYTVPVWVTKAQKSGNPAQYIVDRNIKTAEKTETKSKTKSETKSKTKSATKQKTGGSSRVKLAKPKDYRTKTTPKSFNLGNFTQNTSIKSTSYAMEKVAIENSNYLTKAQKQKALKELKERYNYS